MIVFIWCMRAVGLFSITPTAKTGIAIIVIIAVSTTAQMNKEVIYFEAIVVDPAQEVHMIFIEFKIEENPNMWIENMVISRERLDENSPHVRGLYRVHPFPRCSSHTSSIMNSNAPLANRTNDKLFILGNAMSPTPITAGVKMFAAPPITSGPTLIDPAHQIPHGPDPGVMARVRHGVDSFQNKKNESTHPQNRSPDPVPHSRPRRSPGDLYMTFS